MNRATARQAWERWQLAAGPWRGWSICPMLLSPEVENVPTATASAQTDEFVEAMLPLLEPAGVLLLLDLDPVLAVAAAAQLADVAHPVLVLPRWPYEQAVLPCEALVGALVANAQALPRSERRMPSVLFVIDGARALAVPGRKADDPRADNRHTLSPFDLPSLATLRARGIRRIHRLRHA